MILLLSVKAADHWCWGGREARHVRSFGRPAEALEEAEGAACLVGAVEATEVSPRDLR